MSKNASSHIGLTVMAAGALALTGCTTTVERVDPTQERMLTTQFSADDMQQTVVKMVESMQAFPPIVQITAQRRPVIVVDTIKNNTSQYLDLESLTNSMRTSLIRSGKFRFTDPSKDVATANEINRQRGGGLVDPAKAKQTRKQEAPEFMLYGAITEMNQSAGRTSDVYYKITLNLQNIETGVIEWTDEQSSRKIMKRAAVGW